MRTLESWVLKSASFEAWKHSVSIDMTELSLNDWVELWWKPGFTAYDTAMAKYIAAEVEYEARQRNI
jgi:hypothetical protein